jgi:hypothetical protein
MAQAIRQIGLKLVTALLRLCVRPAPAGWRRSTRPPADLSGR